MAETPDGTTPRQASIDSRMKSQIAVSAFNNAVAHSHAKDADVAGCVLHTDRGFQFRSRKLV
jgi:hypothetical protein